MQTPYRVFRVSNKVVIKFDGVWLEEEYDGRTAKGEVAELSTCHRGISVGGLSSRFEVEARTSSPRFTSSPSLFVM